MRSPENSPEINREAEGVRWLELLGEGELVGTPIPYFKDGRQLRAEEFTLIYDEGLYKQRVRPLFIALENIPPEDPTREEKVEALRSVLHHYLNKPEQEA